jgi:hypothetical protein
VSSRFRTESVTVIGPEMTDAAIADVLDGALKVRHPGAQRIGSWSITDGAWECEWDDPAPEWQ